MKSTSLTISALTAAFVVALGGAAVAQTDYSSSSASPTTSSESNTMATNNTLGSESTAANTGGSGTLGSSETTQMGAPSSDPLAPQADRG